MSALTGPTSRHLTAARRAYEKYLAKSDPDRQERLWNESEKVAVKPRRKSGGKRRG